MPLLDEFTRKMHAILPQWMSGQMSPAGDPMQGMIPGQAQLRTPGHPTAFILPQDQYQSAVNAFGKGGEQAMTLQSPGVAEWLLSRFSPSDRALYSASQKGPAIVAPQDANRTAIQHEAFHGSPFQSLANRMNPQDIQKMIPPEAWNSLARYYRPEEMAGEVGARLISNDPHSLQLDTGNDRMRQYVELIRKTNPSQATALAKWAGLSGSEKGDNSAVLQKPNDTF